MTFNEAFNIAINNIEFKTFYEKVKSGEDTGCLLFAINGEAFGYGTWDGNTHRIKHNAYLSEKLISQNKCLIIER